MQLLLVVQIYQGEEEETTHLSYKQNTIIQNILVHDKKQPNYILNSTSFLISRDRKEVRNNPTDQIIK